MTEAKKQPGLVQDLGDTARKGMSIDRQLASIEHVYADHPLLAGILSDARAELEKAGKRWREVIDEPPAIGSLVERMAVDSHYTSIVRVTELDGILAVGHDRTGGYRVTFTLWRPAPEAR